MGEAKNNPRSLQYKGPLPENKITAHIVTQQTPSEAWLTENPGADPATCPIEHMETAFMLAAEWRFPSNLDRTRPDRWPGEIVPVACIWRESTVNLYRRVAATMVGNGKDPPPPLTGADEPGGPEPAPPDPEAS